MTGARQGMQIRSLFRVLPLTERGTLVDIAEAGGLR